MEIIMKKVTIIALFLTTLFATQQTYCMKGFAQKASNYFRIGLKTLNMAGIVGAYAATVKTSKEGKETQIKLIKEYAYCTNVLEQDNPLSADTQQTIFNFIYAAYPEIRNFDIEIIENSSTGFAVINTNNKVYLLVPFAEKEFQRALELKEKNMQGFTSEKLNELKGEHTIPQYIALEEAKGKAMQPTTINTWKAILLHEASHIAHRDGATINPAPYVIVLLGAEKLKNIMGLDSAKYIKSPIINNLLKGVGSIASFPLKMLFCSAYFTIQNYWREYRADHDAIEKTTNPKLLQAKSKCFNDLPQFTPTTEHQKIAYYLVDTHLAHKTRAEYFKKAGDKLEHQRNDTMEAVKHYMDNADTPQKD